MSAVATRILLVSPNRIIRYLLFALCGIVASSTASIAPDTAMFGTVSLANISGATIASVSTRPLKFPLLPPDSPLVQRQMLLPANDNEMFRVHLVARNVSDVNQISLIPLSLFHFIQYSIESHGAKIVRWGRLLMVEADFGCMLLKHLLPSIVFELTHKYTFTPTEGERVAMSPDAYLRPTSSPSRCLLQIHPLISRSSRRLTIPELVLVVDKL